MTDRTKDYQPSHDELLRRQAEARSYPQDYDPVRERERADEASTGNRLRRQEDFVRPPR